MAKPPRLKDDGEPDMRGHAEGSKATRFGQDDGRPRPGRSRGAKDERTLVQLIKDMPVSVSMAGLPRRIDTQFAYLLKLREKALKGDLKAIDMLDRKLGQYMPPSVQPDLTADLMDEDLVILRNAAVRGSVSASAFTPSSSPADAAQPPAADPSDPA